MALKIRLRRQGRKNQPFYRLVVIDARHPSDGKYNENLGWYNPFQAEEEKNLLVHADRVAYWLNQGAIPTEKAMALIKRSHPKVAADYVQKQVERRAKYNKKGKKTA